tara:strand:+ start:718 stop:822 length:105 start_codon:yes stop_codon:yes gene_type:complete
MKGSVLEPTSKFGRSKAENVKETFDLRAFMGLVY